MPDSSENNVACRICMDPKDEYVSLFISDLSKKVMEIADVRVEKHDGLPENVCVQCEKDLEKCYEFRLKVQVADKKFRQNLKFSQVDIEECKIKEERYVIDDDSDNGDDKHSESMDEENYDEPDVPQRINEETEVPVPDPLNHVVVIEEEEKKVEMSENPVSYDDSKAEEEKVDLQKMEEVSVNPLDSMKEETETEMMDIDGNQPDAFGPSSSVRTTELQKSVPNLMSTPTPSSTSDALAKGCKIAKTDHNPRKTIESGEPSESEGNQTQLLPALPQDSNADDKPSSGNNEKPDQGFMLIPHQLGLYAGLLIPFAPGAPETNTALQSDVNDVGNVSSKSRACNPKDKTFIEPKAVKSLKSSSSASRSSNLEVEVDGKDECFCTVCNIDFGFPDLLEEHKKGKEFICRSCTVIFNNHKELEAHFFSHRKFICKVCKQVFHVKSDLMRHKDTAQSCKRPEILKCKYCHNRFVHESNLLSHIEVKHPNAESRPFTCNICNSGFKINATFREHLKSCHTVYESMECDICHKILPGPSSLKTHVKNKHIQSVSEICSLCNKVLSSKTAFKLHMETHNGEEKVCYICGAVIKGKTTFKQHIYYHENRRHSCSFCNIAFNSLLEKNRHYREKHNASKPAICEICGKEFKAREILKNHMMTHSDEKPYVCSVCGAAFKSKTVLKTHSRVHSEHRKYTCNYCGEAFRWKQTFDKHTLKCGSSQNETGTGIN